MAKKTSAELRLYEIASRELRKRHSEEYSEILRGLQAEHGVRTRRTKDEMRRDDIAAAKALLAEEGIIPE
jgi:hypothetical protein